MPAGGNELGSHVPGVRRDPKDAEAHQRQLLRGWLNATGEVTIADLTGTTVVSDDRVTPDSAISLQPTDAEGQAMFPKVFVQTIRPGGNHKVAGGPVGDFVLAHPLFARDYTFRYLVLG